MFSALLWDSIHTFFWGIRTYSFVSVLKFNGSSPVLLFFQTHLHSYKMHIKITLSICLFICTHVTAWERWMDSHEIWYWWVLWKIKPFQMWLQLENNNGHFRWRLACFSACRSDLDGESPPEEFLYGESLSGELPAHSQRSGNSHMGNPPAEEFPGLSQRSNIKLWCTHHNWYTMCTCPNLLIIKVNHVCVWNKVKSFDFGRKTSYNFFPFYEISL